MRRRTKAREYAVQFLYQLDLRGAEAAEEAMAGVNDFLDAAEDEDHDTSESGHSGPGQSAPGQKEPGHIEPVASPREAGSERVRRGPRRDREMREFARRLIDGTLQQQKEIDQILVAVTRNWDLRRMAAIDRNILRMAIFELMHCADIPPKVTINEAIELGKRFSTANSGSFVNGILDRVRIDIDKGVTAAPARRPLEQGT